MQLATPRLHGVKYRYADKSMKMYVCDARGYECPLDPKQPHGGQPLAWRCNQAIYRLYVSGQVTDKREMNGQLLDPVRERQWLDNLRE